MQELDKRIGLLRLLLADVQGKQRQLSDLENQYGSQLARVVEFVVYREGDVANALSLMGDVQNKLDEVVQTRTHLDMIAAKANMELDVLMLTKNVTAARSKLAELEERQRELSERLSHIPAEMAQEPVLELEENQIEEIRYLHVEVEEVSREIARLNGLITEASERAVRTIQGGGAAPVE
jgi:hypothetical protein